jgi:RimJ/RimL family protein N-acetyltransferase
LIDYQNIAIILLIFTNKGGVYMNPIMIPFPDRIESERLYIRPALPGDGEVVHQAIVESRKELKEWLPFAQKEQTKAEVEINIRKAYSEFITREDIRLHIFRKTDDEFIGSTGLHRINWDVRKFEIGYWIHTKHTGHGYMTEAVKRLTSFVFDELDGNRVEIRCDPENIRSRTIPERLGFTLEGILRNDSLSAEGTSLRSTCVYSVLKDEWNELRK